MIHNSILIFTDGSSRGNPGPGGFGAVAIFPKNGDGELKVESVKLKVKEIGGREDHTTNNRMELRACIEALNFVSNVKGQMSIVVFSDSSYVINGITKWVFGWQKNGWKTATKNEVENRDLWEQLFAQTKDRKIEWKQVSGHVGIAGNERCDEIATAFADNVEVNLYSGDMENYSVKNILDLKEDAVAASTKSSSRNHSKAKAYSYVSMVDGKIETHKTWAECEARVKGKPAKYKKSLSAEDEAKIIAQMKAGK